MRVLLENAWESFPLPRLAGVSTVMRTLPPQPPEGHQRRRRGRHECVETARVTEVQFQSPREVLCVFRTPRCINQKQLITITDNETIGRVNPPPSNNLQFATKH